MIWFTADTHFGSERTLKLSFRPFESVDEMDKYMIEMWNSLVEPSDLVFHLGDFGNFEIAEQLNGKIVLIKGNYDYPQLSNINISDPNSLPAKNFFRIKDFLVVDDLLEEGESCLLIHEPLHARDLVHNYDFNFVLFGHIHNTQTVKRYGINVGVDCHNYAPVPLTRLRQIYDVIRTGLYDENCFNQLNFVANKGERIKDALSSFLRSQAF